VRWVVLVVVSQAARRVTASKPAVILVIILFELGNARGGILPTVFIITIFRTDLARRIFANRDAFLRKGPFPR
jgi:hypothetical protein